MRYCWLLIVYILVACSTDEKEKPEENIESYTGELWRSNSILLEIQLATDLSASDTGPFLIYDRLFDVTVLPENIVLALQALDVSLPPEEFSVCMAVDNKMFIVSVTDNNGNLRQYVDEGACNIHLLPVLPQPDEIVGILDQEQMLQLRDTLLEFDPRVTNP